MAVDVIHPSLASVPRSELADVVAGMFSADPKLTLERQHLIRCIILKYGHRLVNL
jgi:hypothetical protein